MNAQQIFKIVARAVRISIAGRRIEKYPGEDSPAVVAAVSDMQEAAYAALLPLCGRLHEADAIVRVMLASRRIKQSRTLEERLAIFKGYYFYD